MILSLDGQAVGDAGKLRELLGQHVPDDSVELAVRRGDQSRKISLKLAALPLDLPDADLPPARELMKDPAAKPPQTGRIALGGQPGGAAAVAYVPEGYRADAAHGLVVWLAGAGGIDEKELLAQWKPLCDRHEMILLIPTAGDSSRWPPDDMRKVIGAVAEIAPSYTIDPERVGVIGRGSGGKAALELALSPGSPLHGVAVVDASAVVTPPENDPAIRRTFFFGVSQASSVLGSMRRLATQLKDMKYPVTEKDMGLVPRPLSDDELAELARWIDALDRI